jgi:nucleoside-diphosphate-sugar epimerase
LVTGATGFVGKRIVEELARRGQIVVGLGGPSSGKPADWPSDALFYTADVGDKGSLTRTGAFASLDAVVHAAGIAHRFGGVSPEEFQRVNVCGVRNTAELAAAAGARHFILISSVLVYGKTRQSSAVPAISEVDPCLPDDAYSRSKLEAELVATEICKRDGIALTILRPAPIIGEGSKGNFARLIRAIDARLFVWIGRGSNRKSLVYVGDVASTVSDLVKRKNLGIEIFNLAGEAVEMGELVNAISSELGHRSPRLSIPPGIARAILRAARISPFRKSADRIGKLLDTWLSNDVYSTEAIRSAYGITAKTPILEAVRRESAYYLTNK